MLIGFWLPVLQYVRKPLLEETQMLPEGFCGLFKIHKVSRLLWVPLNAKAVKWVN